MHLDLAGSFKKYFQSLHKRWLFLSLFFSVLFIVPLLILFKNSFAVESVSWAHIKENLLTDYIYNSVFMLLVVGIVTVIIALTTAWILSEYTFFWSRLFSWALVLPLAFPAYIMAYSYAGIFNFTGPFYTFVSNYFGDDLAHKIYFDIKNKWVLFSILSLVLYPYIFIPLQASFNFLGTNYTHAAKSLGANKIRIFFKIKLPLLRPAIYGGLFLVMMELLNEYGAVKYFGYNTLTVGIFKIWFALGDLNAAIRVSCILAFIVFILMAVEKLLRSKKKYNISATSKPLVKKNLRGIKSFLAFAICAIPFFLGFILPFAFNLFNSFYYYSRVINSKFWLMLYNTFAMAFVSAFLIFIVASIIFYAYTINKNWFTNILSKFSAIGYALPGAVIAVGILFTGGGIDKILINYGWILNPILSGSLVLIVFAYIFRFLAVASQPIDAGFQQLCKGLDESSRSLGKGPFKTFIRVNLPVLKKIFLGTFILVFVDILKELPLTLILRPFNFETLATKTFEYANDEQMAAASVPSIIIILMGLLSVYLFNKLIKK